jgi:riboflavin kinase/FMN adenylyltransferase
LDFQGDAYNKNITLSFIEFLRPERTFGSLDKLQYAIELSVLEARQVLKEYI